MTVYKINGKEVSRSEFLKARKVRLGVPYSAKTFTDERCIVSEAAGVHPDQIADSVEHAKRNGVPTHFDSEGRPHFKSFRHQERYLNLIGMHRK